MGQVRIVEADGTWVSQFQQVREHLRASLAEAGSVIVRIDHIGSTAVPGLAAKDVIDVQVSVVDDAALAVVADHLHEQGWPVVQPAEDHLVPGEDPRPECWVKVFARERPGDRRANVHVRVVGRPNQRYALLFRDYLQAHPDAALAYERFKRSAAALLPDDVDTYADLKDPVCDLVYLSAQDWARRTGWSPGPVDERG